MIFLMFVVLLFLASLVSKRGGVRACPLKVDWPGSNCFNGTRSDLLEARVLGCSDRCAVLVRHWIFSPNGKPFSETMLVEGEEISYSMRKRGVYLESPVLLVVLDKGGLIRVGNKELKVPCVEAEVPSVIKISGLPEGSGLKLNGLVLMYTERPGKIKCSNVELAFNEGLLVGWEGCQVVMDSEVASIESLVKEPLCGAELSQP